MPTAQVRSNAQPPASPAAASRVQPLSRRGSHAAALAPPGDIDFAEFVTLMAHKMADEKSEATLKAAFSVFDTSGDGFISAEEMRRIMINVGEPVTLDDVEQVIRKVDIDGDGVINYEEFTKVIIEEKATQFGQAGK